MSQAERKDGSAPQDLPNSSYEWFARALAPDSETPIGLVPLVAVFERGLVTFRTGDVVHDVGAGTGRSSEFVIKKIPKEILPTVDFIISEPSADSRKMLEERLIPIGMKPPTIIKADGVSAVEATGNCDKIFLINAIHLFSEEDRSAVVRAAYGSLNPGGQFIVATTFIKGDIGREETKNLMIPWMRAIREKLSDEEKTIVEAAKQTHQRMVKWEPQRYIQEFTDAGFEVQSAESDVVMPLTREGYEGIAHYKLWNDDMVPGLPIDRQIEVVTTAFRKVWTEQLGRGETDISPRNTLVLVGRKPLAAAS